MKLSTDYKYKFRKTSIDFKSKISNDKEYSLFFPMTGCNYEQRKTLFVVGRACNGWDGPWKAKEQYHSIVESSISVSEDNKQNSQMKWLINRWIVGLKENNYNIKRSSFWRVIQKLTLELNECDDMN